MLSLQPSSRVRVVRFGLHFLALIAIFVASLPLEIQAMVCFAVLISVVADWRQFGALSSELRLTLNGDAELRSKMGAEWRPTALVARFVWPSLIAVRIVSENDEGKKISCRLVLIRGDLPAEDWRRLSVWLRWMQRPAMGPG